MDRANSEVLIDEAVTEIDDISIRELSDLQLAFVGGGSGEVTPY
jgi:hypothetical protein